MRSYGEGPRYARARRRSLAVLFPRAGRGRTGPSSFDGAGVDIDYVAALWSPSSSADPRTSSRDGADRHRWSVRARGEELSGPKQRGSSVDGVPLPTGLALAAKLTSRTARAGAAELRRRSGWGRVFSDSARAKWRRRPRRVSTAPPVRNDVRVRSAAPGGRPGPARARRAASGVPTASAPARLDPALRAITCRRPVPGAFGAITPPSGPWPRTSEP